jgi:predicted permease
MSTAGYPRGPLSAPELKDLRDRGTLFSGFAAIWATSAALTGDGDPEQLRVALVSTNFFSLVGADAALGRTFIAEDEALGPPKAILISNALWQRRYGSDPNIVGRTVRANGQTVTVVGVMPRDFRLWMPPDAAVPDDLDAWLLLSPAVYTRAPRGQMYLRVVGRMNPGVTLSQARAQVDDIARQISREYTDYSSKGRAFSTVGLQADGVRQLRPVLLALFAGVGILLLIACVNVAGLLIARAAARARETAVRTSLGAGRARLFRQHLVEGLLLAAFGAAAGMLLARGGLSVLLALRPAALERLATAHLDGAVLAFTAGVALAWGVLLSLAPVFETLRGDPSAALRHEGRHHGGTVHYRARAAIVVLQIAMTVILGVGAVLMVRTFGAILRVDPGFRSESTLTFRIALPGQRYPNAATFNAFGRRLQHDLAALPGVTSVGSISHLPYENFPNWGGPYISTPGADEATALFADNRAVTPGFFETLGARLVEGRYFTEDDDERRDPVAIVDDQLARRTWPGDTAIGKRIAADPRSTGHPVFWATVVGVVRHFRHRSLLESLNDQVYFAERQIQRNPMAYVVRVSGDATAIASNVRQTVAGIDPLLPVWDVRPFDTYVASARAAQRFTMLLASVFAVVALLLAGVGV